MNARFLSRLFLLVAVAASPVLVGCTDEDPTTGDEQNATSSAGRFETFKGSDGKHYFHLIAGNHEKVLRSQAYASKSAAEKGVASVKTNGVTAKNYKVLEAENGEYYFNLVAANGKVIATSETYDSKSNAQRGADTAKSLIAKNLRIEAAATGGAHFATFDGKNGDSYFNLRAGNGEIVLQSEGYETDAGALNGIDSVRAHGGDTENFEVLETGYSGQAYFLLYAANGETIGRSEVYASVSNANRAVENLADLIASEKVADPE